MIDPSHFHSRPHRIDGSLLRFKNGVVNATSVRRCRAYPYSAGTVRAITVKYNTEVTDHESGRLDGCLRRAAVRKRRAGSRSNDGLRTTSRRRPLYAPRIPSPRLLQSRAHQDEWSAKPARRASLRRRLLHEYFRSRPHPSPSGVVLPEEEPRATGCWTEATPLGDCALQRSESQLQSPKIACCLDGNSANDGRATRSQPRAAVSARPRFSRLALQRALVAHTVHP